MYIHILGVTCVGKDTLIEHLASTNQDVGAIQVGKEFRKRYTAGHFKGLGAMASTEDEAFAIYTEQAALIKDKRYKFVSSQPRLITQVARIEESEPGAKRLYVFIRASDEAIQQRIDIRFENMINIIEAKELAKQRVINDRIQNYDVLLELIKRQAEIIILDSCPIEELAATVMKHVQYYMSHLC